MKRSFRHVLAGMLVLSLGVWGSTLALGASGTAELEGQLEDPNGKLLTGLDGQITATDSASGKVYTGKVERDGHYAIHGLPPGSYNLKLIPGVPMYSPYEQQGIALGSGQTLTMSLQFKWGIALGEIGDDPYILDNDLRAQSHYKDGPTPRTADGHPDLTGEWAPIPHPGFGLPPMQPWAKALNDKLQAMQQPQKNGPGVGGPDADCLPQEATPTREPYAWEFLQTPTRVAQITGFIVPNGHEIYLDGRKHPSSDVWTPSWFGHSVGHWEGDTLVVDTVGFNDITPGYGIHTESLHVIERLTRTSYGHLISDITATDPKAWTGPYHQHLEAGLVTGDEILEWVCFHGGGANAPGGPHLGGSWYTEIEKLMSTVPQNIREVN